MTGRLGDASGDRGALNVVDVLLGLFVLVGLMVLAPVIYTFTSWVSPEVDPLSRLLLQLVVPLLYIGLIVSLGVSARGGA